MRFGVRESRDDNGKFEKFMFYLKVIKYIFKKLLCRFKELFVVEFGFDLLVCF